MEVDSAQAIDPTLLVCTSDTSGDESSPSPPKRAAPEATSTEPRKSRRSSDEAKQARLLARQQRNRQSAQVSREKKKVYVEQLEHKIAVLEKENHAMRIREQEAHQKRIEMDARVVDLGATVRNFEAVLSSLMKASATGTPGAVRDRNLTDVATSNGARHGSTVMPEMTSFQEPGAYAIAAPATASPTATGSRQEDTRSFDSTRLPAAEATTAGACFPNELRVPSCDAGSRLSSDAAANGSSIAQPSLDDQIAGIDASVLPSVEDWCGSGAGFGHGPPPEHGAAFTDVLGWNRADASATVTHQDAAPPCEARAEEAFPMSDPSVMLVHSPHDNTECPDLDLLVSSLTPPPDLERSSEAPSSAVSHGPTGAATPTSFAYMDALMIASPGEANAVREFNAPLFSSSDYIDLDVLLEDDVPIAAPSLGAATQGISCV
ncbi:hypothetical protein MSPP1_000693 [Malassezia sp. CBS 17886]|nr:hypothetical protein MSPP1_000693 [Malassezia sp. CBS 17886]